MMRKLQRLLLVVVLLVAFSWQSALPNTVEAQDAPTERPLLMTHYMPWYQTPDVSGYWGWHWTMENFDPDQLDANGRQQMASHYMPLTGLYDSQDEAVLEYQVLLMKLSGIDGVIVDWYGIEEFRDYAVMNTSTIKLFEYIKKAGLRFIICYEDQTVKHMVAEDYLTTDEAHARGHEDMQFMQDNWFTDDAYVKYEGQPIVFVFGPQYFRTPQDWEKLFEGLTPTPVLVTLDGYMDWAALAGYPWPPMNMAGGITMAPAVLDSYLELFYRNASRRDYVVGSAFPGFHDIYEEGGFRSNYGIIERLDGETMQKTLDIALDSNARIVQLVTWNDYGEGTIIEPTEEFGYQYLEIIQATRQTLDTDFAFTPDDLSLPLRLFTLRKAHAGDADIQASLDAVFDAIVAGDLATADQLLTGLE